MKGINKKGFTLIELLAVIVVLAIVMVLAATTVLPYMANARKDAFATEVNTLKEAAVQAMSLKALGTVKDTDIAKTYTNGYCFTVQNLKDLGLFKKDADTYKGYVEVKVDNQKYTYKVTLKNGEFKADGITGDADRDDLTSDTTTTDLSCPTTLSIS